MNRVAYRRMGFACAFFAICMTASAQFKETPPAPYTTEVARQKIRTLIGNTDPDSRKQTVATLSGLLVWYRDRVDDELIAAWKGDARANVPALMGPLADAHVASSIVEFSWREQRAAAFSPAYVPMLIDLMSRYPASADPVIRDLLGPSGGGQIPSLSQQEADAVCRILLDMPDTGNWKKLALQILPHYRLTVQNLLAQDIRGNNQEKATRAQYWMSDLKLYPPVVAGDQPKPPRGKPSPPPQTTSTMISGRPHIVEQPSGSSPSSTQQLTSSSPQASSLQTGSSAYVPQPFTPAPYNLPYSGPKSGTLKCNGGPIPPNAEYVFHDMPPGNIQVDVDGKPFDARLAPGPGQTQDLILTNKGSSAQKKCIVRWSLMP
jgi:hypothetical protein